MNDYQKEIHLFIVKKYLLIQFKHLQGFGFERFLKKIHNFQSDY